EERGDYAQALEAFRRSLQSREQLDDPFGAAESRNNIGYAHYQLGAYDSAEAFWTQALEAFDQLEDANGSVQVQQNLGLLAYARGRWDDAERRPRPNRQRADAKQ